MPMTISVPLGPGMNADMVISKIQINKEIPATTFQPAK
jgi:hypothetical protein